VPSARGADLRRWHDQDGDLDAHDVDAEGFDAAEVLDREPAGSVE
jgi:hypothetical protein